MLCRSEPRATLVPGPVTDVAAGQKCSVRATGNQVRRTGTQRSSGWHFRARCNQATGGRGEPKAALRVGHLTRSSAGRRCSGARDPRLPLRARAGARTRTAASGDLVTRKGLPLETGQLRRQQREACKAEAKCSRSTSDPSSYKIRESPFVLQPVGAVFPWDTQLKSPLEDPLLMRSQEESALPETSRTEQGTRTR